MSTKTTLSVLLTAAAAVCSAPTAAADPGDQESADQAVRQVYVQVQTKCTPATPPRPESISWNEFLPSANGNGIIHDANHSLGGPFKVNYYTMGVPPPAGSIKSGYWFVSLEFC